MRCLKCNRYVRNKRRDAKYCSDKCKVADYRSKRNMDVTDNSGKTILSLCDYSGNWSAPYFEAGYNVIRIDLAKGDDVRLMETKEEKIYGVLAAPPCTCFASYGACWKRSKEEMIEALSVVDACLRIVTVSRPVFWALENPVGILKRYIGEPAFYFNPCDYGDPYTKRTCLWGKFNKPAPTEKVQPLKVSRGHHSMDQFLRNQGHNLTDRKTLRSITPPGFAKAFYEVNP